MTTPTPDPAHGTLPAIDAALAKAEDRPDV